jgi:mitogen-activated protein kinase 15
MDDNKKFSIREYR